jgi:hypothetical protein
MVKIDNHYLSLYSRPGVGAGCCMQGMYMRGGKNAVIEVTVSA